MGLFAAPMAEVVGDMVGAGITLPGVRGPRRVAEKFADQWCTFAGAPATATMEEQLYRMGTLTAPAGVPGTYRVARRADEPVLIKYQSEFAAEALGLLPEPSRARATLAAAREAGNAYLLWTAGGAPVSMAGMRPTGGRRFGAAVTAEACRWALGAGADQVVLFADLDNPTSNGVYRRLGFMPVGDSVVVGFRVP